MAACQAAAGGRATVSGREGRLTTRKKPAGISGPGVSWLPRRSRRSGADQPSADVSRVYVWLNEQSGVLSIIGTQSNKYEHVLKEPSASEPGGYALHIIARPVDRTGTSVRVVHFTIAPPAPSQTPTLTAP